MMIKTTIFTHGLRVSLARFSWWPSQSIAGDVKMTRQLWRDHVNELWYLTCYASILFTAIFTAGRVRNCDITRQDLLLVVLFLIYGQSDGCYNMGYPYIIHLKLESREITFVHWSELHFQFDIVHRARQHKKIRKHWAPNIYTQSLISR